MSENTAAYFYLFEIVEYNFGKSVFNIINYKKHVFIITLKNFYFYPTSYIIYDVKNKYTIFIFRKKNSIK